MASRTRCNINQAVFWVTPRARAISQELIPFFALAIIQTQGSHLSKPIGLSSKIVPTLAVKRFLQALHCQVLRVVMYECFSVLLQCGHTTPSAHLVFTKY